MYTVEFAFLEDRLQGQYMSEQRTGLVLAIFTVIATVIACVGLFGISLLTFQQKVKELSIRKVLGAGTFEVLAQVVGKFTRLICIAVVVAAPVGWLIMSNWLQNFTYRIAVHPQVFLIAGLTLLGVAWLTLGYFTVKALKLNPAEVLKNE